jgi:WD40 repeat protein
MRWVVPVLSILLLALPQGLAQVGVTASDKTAILWETASGKKLQTFQGHTRLLTSVALSADGKRLVTGSNDQAALWDTASGKKLQSFYGPTTACVALSDDGRTVFTGSYDGTVILWEVTTGKQRQILQGHSDTVTGIALSSDHKHLWTASGDGSIRLWNPYTGEERCRLYSLDYGKDWLAVSPDGFFDGSKGGSRCFAYRRPGTLQVVDDEATLQSFYRPGLMGLLLKGQKPPR